jgi:hypothetical protein
MRLLKSLLIVAVMTASVWADGGSLYTRKGIGDVFFSLSARRVGLGGGGYALNSIYDLSNLNPAGWFNTKTVRFDFGMYYNSSYMKNTTLDANYAQTNIAGFTIAIPIDTTHGIVLAAGMAPYSNVMYEVVQAKTDPLVGDYKATYEGSGGINKIFVGLTAKLPFNFSLGAAFDYYYGKIEYNTKSTIDNTNYSNGVFQNLNNFQGTGINIGILTPDLSRIFNSKDISDFHLGFAADYVFNMKRDSSELSGNADSTYTSFSSNQKVKIPLRLGGGLTVKLFNRYLLVADYINQPFEKLEINEAKVGSFQTLNRYSFGVEYRNPTPKKDSYWDKVALRLGFSHETTQYFLRGVSLDENAIHAGISFPIDPSFPGNKGNFIDIGLTYGSRGTTDNGLIKENFFNLSVGISMGELWFLKTER